MTIIFNAPKDGKREGTINRGTAKGVESLSTIFIGCFKVSIKINYS